MLAKLSRKIASMANSRRPWQGWLLVFFLACSCIGGGASPLPMSGQALSKFSPALSPSLRFDQFGEAQGLGVSAVTAIAQDRQGFMWFGSQSGLSRFDGYRTTVYRTIPADPHSLQSDRILSLHVDQQGRIWVGTGDGLNLYDASIDGFIQYRAADVDRQGKKNFTINKIIDDGHGAMWLGTGDGLQHFDPSTGKFTALRHDPDNAHSLVNDTVGPLAIDSHGGLWVGSNGGLDYLALPGTTFRHYPLDTADNRLPLHNAVRALLIDQTQTLWIGTASGIEAWHLGAGEPQRPPGGADRRLPTTEIFLGFLEDNHGTLWAIGAYNGLFALDRTTDRFRSYRHLSTDPFSLVDNQLLSIFQDRTGSLWVGTWTKGTSRVDLNSGGFTRFEKESAAGIELTDSNISAISDAGEGRLWLGTGHGINLFDPVSGAASAFQTEPKRPNGPVSEVVLSMAIGPDRQPIVGTLKKIFRFDPATSRFSVLQPTILTPENYRGMKFDRSGMLWVITNGGLYRLDLNNKVTRKFQHNKEDPDSLSNDGVSAWTEDRQGGIWLGTAKGLDRFDPHTEKFTHFKNRPGQSTGPGTSSIWALFSDDEGRVWAAGNEIGLVRVEPASDGNVEFRSYLDSAGNKLQVSAMLDDRFGNSWVSTLTGLSRVEIA